MTRECARSRLLACMSVVALAALLPAGARAKPADGGLQRRIAAVVRARHLKRSQVDPAAVAREVRDRLEVHPSLYRKLGELIDWEVDQAFFGFAPEAAVPDASARYRLPYDSRIPRECALGVGGKPAHVGRDRYAWDFDMPRGAKILAARGGVVARVVDGFTRGALDKSLMRRANLVIVQHDDGTFAMYVHLSPGIPVKEGQRVKAGAVLGRSGSTGFASGPHLHFEVLRKRADDQEESVPIRFTGGPHGPFVPKARRFYGWIPRSTVPMRIFVRGALVRGRAPIPLARGAVLPLRVVIWSHGRARNVSADPSLRLVPMTPSNSAVDGPGRIAARPTAGFANPADHTTVGIFLVYYGLDGGPEFAVRELKIALSP